MSPEVHAADFVKVRSRTGLNGRNKIRDGAVEKTEDRRAVEDEGLE